MKLRPTTPEDVRDAVAGHPRVLAHGAHTKPALSHSNGDTAAIDMTGLAGVVAYEPDEFIFTAKAGTPLREVAKMLEEQKQYMPFDPPLVEAGATVGGTVAAGLSGPGRYRYGGLRDFLLEVQFVDGTGTLVRAGGKVVKNAAGFDFPKLLIGSAGKLGVLTELTFKVFPRAQATATFKTSCHALADAVRTMARVAGGAWDVVAMDVVAPSVLHIRMAGYPDTLKTRFARLSQALGLQGEVLVDEDDATCWRDLRDWKWAEASPILAKVPVNPAGALALDVRLDAMGARRHYSVAGNVAFVGLQSTAALVGLQSDLAELGLAGVVLRGDVKEAQLGTDRAKVMADLVKHTLDPEERFPS